jgi:hypothetical protein
MDSRSWWWRRRLWSRKSRESRKRALNKVSIKIHASRVTGIIQSETRRRSHERERERGREGKRARANTHTHLLEEACSKGPLRLSYFMASESDRVTSNP